MTYLLLDGRACSLDKPGIESALVMWCFDAADDKAAIYEAELAFPEQGWALFRQEAMVPVACSGENGVYWRADEEGAT